MTTIIKVKDKAKFIDGIVKSVQEDAKQIIKDQIDQLDRYIDNVNAKAGFLVSAGGVLSALFRGAMNGVVDSVNGLVALGNTLANTITHVFDNQDGTNFLADLGLGFYDLANQTMAGLSSATLGFAADVGKAFGADDNWAYGEAGAISEVANFFKTGKAGVITALSDKEAKDKYLKMSPEEVIESRRKPLTMYAPMYQKLEDNIKKSSERADWVKTNIISEATFKNYFDEKLDNLAWYQPVSSATESIGRLVPVIIFGHLGSKLGLSGEELGMLSKTYFASSVAGGALEEALDNGSSFEDAFIYALGSASSEMIVESLGGLQLSDAMLVKNSGKILQNAMEEFGEEFIQSFGERGLSYYATPDHKIEDKTAKGVWQDAIFSAIVGGIGGGAMSGLSLALYSGTIDSKIYNVAELESLDIEKFGFEKTQDLYKKRTENLLKAFQSDKYSAEEKATLFKENRVVRGLIKEVNGEYVLSEKGKNFIKGDILAKQGGVSISKATHAVGGENYGLNYKTEIEDSKGEKHEIRILTNEEVEVLPETTKNVIDLSKRNNLDVAFVVAEPSANFFKGFTTEGTIYINANNSFDVESILIHEIYDKINVLAKSGNLTPKQNKALKEFQEFVLNEADSILKELKREDIDLEFYKEITKNMPKSLQESILTQEKVALFIQTIFSNENILSAVFDTRQGLFTNFARILNSKMTRENILKKFNTSDVKTIENKLIKMNKMLTKIIKDNYKILKATPRISDISDLSIEQKRVYYSASNTSDEGFLDTNNEERANKTNTPLTNNTLAESVFIENESIIKNATLKGYGDLEERYHVVADELKKSKNPFIKKIYNGYLNILNRTQTKTTIFNHLASAVSQEVASSFNEFLSSPPVVEEVVNRKLRIVNRVNEVIFSTLDYMDKHLTSKKHIRKDNPQGYLYTRQLINYLRDLKNTDFTADKIQQLNTDRRGNAYRRLINAILNYDNAEINQIELLNSLKNFAYMSDTETLVDLGLCSPKGESNVQSIATTTQQWKDNAENINFISEIANFKPKINSAMDLFTVGGMIGLYDNNSWSWVLTNKLVQGAKDQIRVKMSFDEIFSNEWTSKHRKTLRNLDLTEVEINNLGGVKVSLAKIVHLRNMMVREIVQNEAIEAGLVAGEKTHRFYNDSNNAPDKIEIDILGRGLTANQKKDNKTRVSFENSVEARNNLVKELNDIISQNEFLNEYNKKSLEFFDVSYDFINERYKEINGLVLKNYGRALEVLTDEEFNLLDLPFEISKEEIRYIYSPFITSDSGYFDADTLDLKSVMDFGVFDGMTRALTDTSARIVVDSMNSIIERYLKHTANYYGLERVIRDFNLILTQEINKTPKTTLRDLIDRSSIQFYNDLILDMLGYRPPTRSPGFKQFLTFMRRNFYKASLGLNVKVITTQFATFNNLVILYGNGNIDFYGKMLKNFAGQHTKENREKIKWLIANNEFVNDRAEVATFDMGEATKEGFGKANWFSDLTEKTMAGIKFTDNSINYAFFLTLLETINPETNTFYTMEEASEMVSRGILYSQSSALALTKSSMLRTDNEVLKIFLKFLGEPLKLYTQLHDSVNKIRLVKAVESNRDSFLEEGLKERAEINRKVERAEELRDTARQKEDASNFNDLSDKEQREIRDEVRRREREVEKLTRERNIIQEKIDKRNFHIETLIKNKKLYQKQFKQRIGATLSTMVYMTFLSTIFSLVRGKFGEKDKKQNEAYSEYMLKLIGANFFENLFTMLPGVRDAYQIVFQGYSITEIDEIGVLDDLGRSLNYMLRDIIEGREIKWGKTGRITLGALGQMFGVPVRGLERLFTTPMLYIDETVWYKYHNFIGRQTKDNVELAKAIKEGNMPMIEAVISKKMSNRKIEVSKRVYNEMVRLASKGEEVKITGISRKITIEGEEITMTDKELYDFKTVYKNADVVAQKMIMSMQYRKLNDNSKRSILTSIYNYYLRKAKQDVLGADLIPEKNYFKTMQKAYNYFLELAEGLYRKQQKGVRSNL